MSFSSNYFKQTNNIFNLKLKPNQFTILSYLIRMANESENCYPSMNNISEMCRVSKSTVVKTIEELEQAGYINVNINNTYNVYTINYDVIENTNNRPEKVKRTRTQKVLNTKEFKTEELPVDSNGNVPIEDQIYFTEVKKIIELTGVTEEEATKELNISKSKDNINNVVQYTIGTIRNKQNNVKLNKEIENQDYENSNKLEAMLLGFEDYSEEDISEILKVGNGNYISNNNKRFKTNSYR